MDNIKLAIEYLLGLQDKQAQIIDKMDKDLRSRNYLVDKLMKEAGERDQNVKDCQTKIKDLESKSIDNENRLFSMNTDNESFRMNFQIFQRGVEGLKDKIVEYNTYGERLSNCEREIEDLKRSVAKASRPVFQGGEGVDTDAIEDMLDNMKKEMFLLFAKREDLEKLGERVTKLETDYKTMDVKVDDTSDLAHSNKEEIEKLKKLVAGKVDSDIFDQQLANLQEAISNAGGDVSKVAASTGGNISTKDMNNIKDMISKFPDLEKAIAELQKQMNDKVSKKAFEGLEKEMDNKVNRDELEKIIKDLKDLQKLLEHLTKDIDFLKATGGGSGGSGSSASPDVVIQITNKIEKLEIKVGNLENELNGLRRTKAQTVSLPPPNVGSSNSFDSGRVDSIEKRMDEIENDFKKFNNEIVKEIKNHQDQINGKADYAQLEELKDFLLGKIDDLLRGFKQFADKNDTKKALKNLEKQLKNLYDLVMSKLRGEEEDDAMFSKKPLGGFSCAS